MHLSMCCPTTPPPPPPGRMGEFDLTFLPHAILGDLIDLALRSKDCFYDLFGCLQLLGAQKPVI